MLELTEADLWEGLTAAERREIPLEDFAWPEERKFPIDSQSHLDAAAKLIGRAPEDKQAEIKARAIRIAKRKGFTLPDTWKEEKQESTASLVQAATRPRKKIGTLKVCWLEYNARSLNGRIYPAATCDAIFKAAQRKVANDDLPATVFVSHEAANSNGNMELVGRVAKVWQEGSKFYANLDLADTRAAHDMLALAEGGYLRSESMRVAGVELVHDNNYDLPLVVVQQGVEPDFLGIDLTTRPGLADSARILQTLYEAHTQNAYIEVFGLDNVLIESKEEASMAVPIYLQVIAGVMQEAMTEDRKAHQRVHDHLAGIMDEVFGSKHGSESARYRALVEGQLDEAGRAIAMKHAQRLAAAHDESARQLGMKCEGVYNDLVGTAPSDTDNDGDNPAAGYDPDNDGESARRRKGLNETMALTQEQIAEALKLAQAQGYQIAPPKSEKERIAELEARLAEQDRKLAQLTEAAPQRQTLANPSQFEEGSTLVPEDLYQEGDLMKGDLRVQNWSALADRRVPWPHDKLDPKQALHEMAPFLAQRLLSQEANAYGRSVDQFIGPNEEI